MKTEGRRARLHLTHLGAAGWIITDGQTTVLLDPYLPRIRFSGRTFGPPEAATVPGGTRPLVTISALVISKQAGHG